MVRAPSRALVVLDHDGTLSPIAATPDAAHLADGAADALARLATVADVAILSGRGLADLARRFDGLPLTLVSEHGLRAREDDGTAHELASPLDAAELEQPSEVRAVLVPNFAELLIVTQIELSFR
jgi:trehalose-phosphatase